MSTHDPLEPAATEPTVLTPPSENKPPEASDSPPNSIQPGSVLANSTPATGTVLQATDIDAGATGAVSREPSEGHVADSATAPADSPPTPVRGSFERSSIGEPGRSATTVVPKFDANFPDVHDLKAHGSVVGNSNKTGELAVRAVSLSGLSHRHYGNARQDSYALAQSRDAEFFVCAVADGLGSAPSSHLASVAASRAAVDEVAKQLDSISLDQMDWSNIMRIASDAIREAAPPELRTASLQLLSEEMCTTLVIAALPVSADVDGLRKAVISRIGDSSAWVLDPQEGISPLGSVKNDGAGIAGSGTNALPSSSPIGADTVALDLHPHQVLLLVSDGLGDPLANGRGEVGLTLMEWWAEPPELFEFIGQADFARKSYDDDRTVVAVWPTRSQG